MKTYAKIILAIAIFFHCTDTKNPVFKYEESGIAFYFLEDTKLSIQQALQKDINSLNTQSQPWLTSDDISIYDYSTHLIYLKGDKEKYIPKLENQNNSGLVPFILKAKNQPVFVGALYTDEIAYIPDCPTIQGLIAFDELYPKDVIQLLNFLPMGRDSINVLNDENFKNALIQSSIYHGGITLKLDTIVVVENSDTATINYTLTYENNDTDNLYVLDPHLIAPEVFHCFSSGIIFRDSNMKSIEPLYQDKCSQKYPYCFNPSWFNLLACGEKLTRTVILKGYPNIPTGKYSCELYMTCMFQIEFSQRYVKEGRYWLGYLQASKDFNY